MSLTTGEMFLTHTDARLGDLVFARTYNSARRLSQRYGAFGQGWNSTFEERLRVVSPFAIERRLPDGTPVYYLRTGSAGSGGNYRQELPRGPETWVEPLNPGYKLHHRAGGFEIFDANGRIVSRTEPGGIVTTFTPDSQGRLSTVTRLGRSLKLGYSPSGMISSLSAVVGTTEVVIATYTYDGFQLKSVTYADGNGDGLPDGGYTYNYVNALLTSVQDGDLKTIETHEYDASGRARTSEIADGREKLTFTYNNGVTTVTDSATPPNVTTYEWQDVKHVYRVNKVTGPCSSCGGGGSDTQEWTYNADGWIETYEDGEGNVTSYTYDPPTGDLLTETKLVDPLVPTNEFRTTFTYFQDGRIQTRTDPNGSVTSYTYVPAGPETITQTVSTTENRVTLFEYTALGQLWKITDPLQKVTELHYTSTGDLEWSKDPLAHITHFQYDLLGRRTKTVLPATTPPNDSPTTSYDTLGRVWRVTNPNGSYWEHLYDGAGHKKSVRDPAGQTTQYIYDAWGRLLKILDAAGGATEFTYDLMSNTTSLKDALTQTTTFTYDAHHRVKKVTYPSLMRDAPFEEFTYDHAGRLKTRRDRKGVTTTFAYDGLGRLITKTYSDGSPAVTFGYDANGDLGFMTSATNSADTLTRDYDFAGRMLSEASSRTGTTMSYVYDLGDRRMTLRRNGSDILAYLYDPDGELDKITYITPAGAPAAIFDFNPDAAHRRQSVAFPNNTTTEYGYDLLSRLSLIRLKRGATVINEIAYESNDLSNRTSRTENATRLEYGYDELSRLRAVDRTAPTPTVRQEDYTYDAVGNRLTALGVPGPWNYNERNELLSYNGITLGYDTNGNQISRSGSPARTYVWDVENRLVNAKDNGVSVASFEYDPLGRRVAKTVGNTTTLFEYDGEDVLLEGGTSGSLYVHGPGIDEPLARGTLGGILTHFYHLDGLNSLVKRTDGGGNVEGSRTYDSFGQPALGIQSGYAFTSREWDAETGLYLYRARFYEPKIGRFLSPDPIGFRAGPNFFAYALNNPIVFVDPFGLESGNLNDLVPGPNGEGAGGATCAQRRQPFGTCYQNCMAMSSPPTGVTEVTTLAGMVNAISKVPIPACRVIGAAGLAINFSRITSCTLVCGDPCAQFE